MGSHIPGGTGHSSNPGVAGLDESRIRAPRPFKNASDQAEAVHVPRGPSTPERTAVLSQEATLTYKRYRSPERGYSRPRDKAITAFAVEEELLHDSWDDLPVAPGSISELMAMPSPGGSEPEPLATAAVEAPPVQLAPIPPPTEKTHTSIIERVFSLLRKPH